MFRWWRYDGWKWLGHLAPNRRDNDEEFVDRKSVGKVVEQSLGRHAGALKHQGAVKDLGRRTHRTVVEREHVLVLTGLLEGGETPKVGKSVVFNDPCRFRNTRGRGSARVGRARAKPERRRSARWARARWKGRRWDPVSSSVAKAGSGRSRASWRVRRRSSRSGRRGRSGGRRWREAARPRRRPDTRRGAIGLGGEPRCRLSLFALQD